VDRAPEGWAAGVAALEAEAWYPLGPDRFRIDHGADYFAFFRRLGALRYYAVEVDGAVVAVGAGVLRRVPVRPGRPPRRAWYLCDLKVRPDHRGSHLPLRLLGRAFPLNYLRCPRGYAISMDPADGPNRVVRLLQRFRWARASLGATLELFSLDADAIARARPTIEAERGPISFLSLAGVKEIVLESTGRPMPLRHVQHGPCAEAGAPEPEPGAVHMLCAPRGDALSQRLRALGHAPSATASVLHHRMAAADWRFVLTSDI
jgi:hypothetical protein